MKSAARSYQPAERLPLTERVDYALTHIAEYERDIIGRVPLDVFGLKRLLEDVARELRRTTDANGNVIGAGRARG